MKKFLAGILAACVALTVCGCSQPSEQTPDQAQQTASTRDTSIINPSENAPVTVSANTMHAVALPTVKEDVFNSDGTLLHSFSYPQVQVYLGDPSIEAIITADITERIKSIEAESNTICEDAQSAFPETDHWNNYFVNFSYTPTRLDQSVMSLFGNEVTYSGGAHPYVITNSVTYDLQTGQALSLKDVLQDNYNKEALYSLVLKALESKAEELYYDYQSFLTERFSEDAAFIEDWYFSPNGLCFHFFPYDIAPYSSGTIVAEIPYHELTGLLRQQYFPVDAHKGSGSMYAEAYDDANADRFQVIADLRLAESTSPIVVYSDAQVNDIRLEIGTLLEGSSNFITTDIIFAADTVDIGDAIRIFPDSSNADSLLRLVYHSGNHEISSLITIDPTTGNILLTSK